MAAVDVGVEAVGMLDHRALPRRARQAQDALRLDDGALDGQRAPRAAVGGEEGASRLQGGLGGSRLGLAVGERGADLPEVLALQALLRAALGSREAIPGGRRPLALQLALVALETGLGLLHRYAAIFGLLHLGDVQLASGHQALGGLAQPRGVRSGLEHLAERALQVVEEALGLDRGAGIVEADDVARLLGRGPARGRDHEAGNEDRQRGRDDGKPVAAGGASTHGRSSRGLP